MYVLLKRISFVSTKDSYYWWTANILQKKNIFIIVILVYALYIIKSINIRSGTHIIVNAMNGVT